MQALSIFVWVVATNKVPLTRVNEIRILETCSFGFDGNKKVKNVIMMLLRANPT
jgi:hypothetical protein